MKYREGATQGYILFEDDIHPWDGEIWLYGEIWTNEEEEEKV